MQISPSINPDQQKSRLREPFAAASHLAGALLGVVGAVYLVYYCDGRSATVIASLVYCLAMIALFLASGLFHGLHCSEAMIEKLERLDYAAIYLFIAGTYTPVCLFVIKGSFGLGLLIGEWALALTGFWLAITRGPTYRNRQVAIYLAMGWAFVLALPSLSKALSPIEFDLLILGGVFYSVGAVIFAFDWQNICRTRLSAHDCWHVLVLLGSGAHYAFVVQVMT